MEELKIVSPEEKEAFKKHYSQIHRAFEKLAGQIKNNRNNVSLHRYDLKSSRKTANNE